jgi:hypothetical protein
MNPKDHGECFVLDDGYANFLVLLLAVSSTGLASNSNCLMPDSDFHLHVGQKLTVDVVAVNVIWILGITRGTWELT